MTENISEMIERHNEEIAELQESCSHEETKRVSFMNRPGAFANDVEECTFCGKILKHYEDRKAI